MKAPSVFQPLLNCIFLLLSPRWLSYRKMTEGSFQDMEPQNWTREDDCFGALSPAICIYKAVSFKLGLKKTKQTTKVL